MRYWLMKSEPSAFSWQKLLKDGKTMWDGVRNFQARNNLRAMQLGDLGLFYHSVDEKCIMGIVRVIKTAYPDPTAKEGDWSVVDVVPVEAFGHHVTLAEIKANPKLQGMALLKQSRLSVCEVGAEEWRILLQMGQVKSVN